MKIKTKLLQEYLQEKNLTVEQLAEDIEISVADLTALLNGEAVDVRPASLFINYFGANKAQEIIDWVAIGKKNPLENDIGVSEVDE